MSFAAVLAAMPDLLERALAEHVPDAYHQCRECRNADGSGAVWPCAMRLLAEEASGMVHAPPPEAPERSRSMPTGPVPVQAPISDDWDAIADRRAFRRDRFRR